MNRSVTQGQHARRPHAPFVATAARACVQLVLWLASCHRESETREPVPSPPSATTPHDASSHDDVLTVPHPRATRPAHHEAFESPATFDRDAWPHWIDEDGDCQDTRTEVLIAESEVPVTFADKKSCTVARGQWRCPYTDRTVTDPRLLDVDHLVPLAEAHRSGGAKWDQERRRAYANDLGDDEHLVAVLARANRSKGARTVVTWLPEEPGFRCEYVTAWRRIKRHWGLVEQDDERRALDEALHRCSAHGVPKVEAKPAPSTPQQPSGGCCRICRQSKPCGNGCIAASRTCHQPPGCACSR